MPLPAPRRMPLLAGLAVVLVAAAAGLALLRRDAAGADENAPTPVVLRISGETLVIPGNAIRFADQRAGGDLPRVDLALLWPDLAGHSAERAEDFAAAGPDSRVLQVAIEPRETDMDSAGRLATIYARFLEDGRFDGPAGLEARRFRSDSAYAGETLYFEPGKVRPFVARCFPTANAGADTLCLTEFLTGRKLTAVLRFRPALLADWAELSERVRAAVAGYGRAAP